MSATRVKEQAACKYCNGRLPDDSPVVIFPDGTTSHVGCEIDMRRLPSAVQWDRRKQASRP